MKILSKATLSEIEMNKQYFLFKRHVAQTEWDLLGTFDSLRLFEDSYLHEIKQLKKDSPLLAPSAFHEFLAIEGKRYNLK